MTITFSMRNVTSELVHTIMLRKFFQMVFVGDDHRSLHIYTATILGASGQDYSADSDKNPEKFISNLGEYPQFRMRFEFAVGSSDNNDIYDIINEDLTDGDPYSFLNEPECISNVWGKDKCSIIINNQKELLEKCRQILNTAAEPDNILLEKTAILSRQKVLWTEQEKNGLSRDFFQSLSIAGQFEDITEPQAKNKRDEIAMRKAYAISSPDSPRLPQGIELVNWVRTTIRFKYPLDDTDLNYNIKKELGGEENSFYFAPDFTWYFSPRPKGFIDSRNCLVELKRTLGSVYETCQCPIQKNRRIFFRSDKFQNSISPVPNKLTVNFRYWIEEENILLRQKYRLIARDIFPRPDDFNDTSEINIFLDTSDEHNRGNRQFLAGVFLSTALAFGIDSTRISEVNYCFFPLNLIIPTDALWIIFLVLFSATLINIPMKLSERSRKLARWRKRLLIASGMWVFMIFGILRTEWMELLIERYSFSLETGIISCFLLSILSLGHILYFTNKNVNAGKNILADLFGEDIL